MIKSIFLLLCCTFQLQGGEASFTAPEGWKKTEQKQLSPKVKIGFHTTSRKGLSPSLNLAVESSNASLDDYLKVVRAIFEKGPQNTWRDLGTIQTRAGQAKITEIDIPSKLGPIRLLQMIFPQDGQVYIVTATALKEEFPALYQTFHTAFKSFMIDKLQ